MNNWITKLEKRFGKYAIHDLMKYICLLYIAGLIIHYAAPDVYYYTLSLNPERILHGEIWRLFTFLIQSPNNDILFFIFTLYLYYMIGQTLEATWGAFRFNLYYFSGVIFTIIGAFLAYFVTGQVYLVDTHYLSLSLFLAFAFLYPDMQLMLFFLIPIKIKWLAYLDMAVFVYGFIIGNIGIRIAIVFAAANFILYFFSMMRTKASPKQMYRKAKYTRTVNQSKAPAKHKCAVCGRTSDSNPELEFRFCSKCNGNYEYCQDHLFTHTHVK